MMTVDRLSMADASGPWAEVMQAADTHDAFQSLGWAGFEARVNGNEPVFLVVRDAGAVVGGQMVLRRPLLGLLRAYEAIGGPVACAARAASVGEAILAFLEKEARGAVYTTVRPREGHQLHGLLTTRSYRPSSLHTVIVDLARPEEEIWRSLDGNARTGVKKGVKAGLEVVEATSPTQWDEFQSVQNAHAREKGNPLLTATALAYMREHLAPSGNCRLFLGLLDGRCVSGMLFAISHESMLFYAGASDGRYLDASPNDPVMWEAMRWGRSHGISQLDLYDTDPRPESPLYGIHRFKTKWGGELVDRPFYVKGRAYLWAREQLRGNGPVRRMANALRARRWA